MSEWITDRLPTEADSDMMNQVWIFEDNAVYLSDYSFVTAGTPWIPIKEPEPYVKPKPERWKLFYGKLRMPIKQPAPYVKPEPKRWKPEVESLHYYISWSGDTNFACYYDHYDTRRAYDFGNIFQTEAQAQEAARRVRELLLNYHKELNNE